MHTLGIRIDAPLESTLARLVQREWVSKSELVRRALQAYVKQRADIVVTPSPSALDWAGDFHIYRRHGRKVVPTICPA